MVQSLLRHGPERVFFFFFFFFFSEIIGPAAAGPAGPAPAPLLNSLSGMGMMKMKMISSGLSSLAKSRQAKRPSSTLAT